MFFYRSKNKELQLTKFSKISSPLNFYKLRFLVGLLAQFNLPLTARMFKVTRSFDRYWRDEVRFTKHENTWGGFR